jgi:large subunit ribosomal protein L10
MPAVNLLAVLRVREEAMLAQADKPPAEGEATAPAPEPAEK